MGDPEAMNDRVRFEAWARDHLGQGYSLEWDDGSYVHPVTRWCFKGYLEGRSYAEEAVRQEREACALIVDAAQEGTLRSATAAAIRARSEQGGEG